MTGSGAASTEGSFLPGLAIAIMAVASTSLCGRLTLHNCSSGSSVPQKFLPLNNIDFLTCSSGAEQPLVNICIFVFIRALENFTWVGHDPERSGVGGRCPLPIDVTRVGSVFLLEEADSNSMLMDQMRCKYSNLILTL